eukprot:scaffold16847_cov173-Skeletonema_marinoi.AAC.5
MRLTHMTLPLRVHVDSVLGNQQQQLAAVPTKASPVLANVGSQSSSSWFAESRLPLVLIVRTRMSFTVRRLRPGRRADGMTNSQLGLKKHSNSS